MAEWLKAADCRLWFKQRIRNCSSYKWLYDENRANSGKS